MAYYMISVMRMMAKIYIVLIIQGIYRFLHQDICTVSVQNKNKIPLCFIIYYKAIPKVGVSYLVSQLTFNKAISFK